MGWLWKVENCRNEIQKSSLMQQYTTAKTVIKLTLIGSDVISELQPKLNTLKGFGWRSSDEKLVHA